MRQAGSYVYGASFHVENGFTYPAVSGLSGLACLVLTLAAPTLAGLLSAGAADRALFVAFVRWSALAGLAAVGPTVLAAALRGWGKAAAAATVSISTAVTQVGMVALLGFDTRLGVFSVPLAVVAGAVVGTVVGGLSWRHHELAMIDLRTGRPAAARTLVAVGGPVATSYLLLFGLNLGLLWVLGPFGTAVVSGFFGAKLWLARQGHALRSAGLRTGNLSRMARKDSHLSWEVATL